VKTRQDIIDEGKDIDKLINDQMTLAENNKTAYNKYKNYLGANLVEGRYEDLFFDTEQELKDYLNNE